MGEVIQLPKRNVQHASTEELKAVWDAWDGDTATMFAPEAQFDMESVHAELNRRGEGQYCAV